MQRKQQTEGGGHALTAPELEKHRKQVAEEGAEADQRRRRGGQPQAVSHQHRHGALEHVAEQGQGGGGFAADAQHIGGAGVAGTLGARVRIAEQPAHQNGAGDRAQQVSGRAQRQQPAPAFL